ncbi:hypothetical protein [Lentzea sp. NPDC092896]|uniref:hypothetical protein n=1 Tax=Lentzea sp. NPDC092896 TaxID=3364127 RepID=UPI00381C39BE
MTDMLDLGTPALTTPAKPAAASPNAKALCEALERHYTGGVGHKDRDSHAVFRELNAPDNIHRADFVAISVWGSRGLAIDVHEVKVSRADWLTELRQPSKAEAWWPYSSRFWLVVPDASLVKPGELPDGWGLMVPPKNARGRAMTIVTPAAVRQPHVPLELLARLLMRYQAEEKRRTEKAVVDAAAQAAEDARRSITRNNDPMTPEQRERLHQLDLLETIVGDKIGTWNGRYTTRQIGDAIRWLEATRRLPSKHELARLSSMADQLNKTVTQLGALVDVVEQGRETA